MRSYLFTFGPAIKKREDAPLHSNYHEYEDILREDFGNHCGYCGCSKEVIQTFEIDHFIPKRVFNGIDDSLESDYTNLVYCCKRCNRSKGGRYDGKKTKGQLKNVLLYDPALVDYNSIFYRSFYGIIISDDVVGKRTIKELRLHNPIYALAWLTERVFRIVDALEKHNSGVNTSNDEKIKSVKAALEGDYMKLTRLINLIS